MIKIIIADDHEIVRAGLKGIIADTENMRVTGEARDGQELLEKIRTDDFNVVLLDISMPGRNGLEILKQLKIEKPNLPVLILSTYPEEQYGVRTIKAGASGYLNKKTLSENLIEAIAQVNQGKKYISPALADLMADLIVNKGDKIPHENLTDREYQIFLMLASGKTVSQIGRELFLSVKTINTYRKKILVKTGMKSNAELTHYAIKNNLLD
ncbi:MAG TPA: response regulator transcription factor [Spirochaetota bacterium]|nr:response regulator transcription factor [Spirochaetota bacterium]HPI90281.1 response regulator transcription factor [Spirochaetota bacterium]HPR46381.1 response regulator transcription factor [Spirochaetota bacterium]